MPDKLLSPTQPQTAIPDSLIVSKINTCIAILEGDAELLATVSSFKSTLSNQEVLGSLEAWIASALKQKEIDLKELWEYSNR